MRIAHVDPKMTWEDFQKKFRKAFPVSDASKRTALMKAEYKKWTGKEPVERKPYKKQEPRVIPPLADLPNEKAGE